MAMAQQTEEDLQLQTTIQDLSLDNSQFSLSDNSHLLKSYGVKRRPALKATSPNMEKDPNSNSSSNSPTVKSPVKHLDADLELANMEDSPPNDLPGTFPTSDQTVLQSFLKEMMLALCSSIPQSIVTAITNQMSVINDQCREQNGRIFHAYNQLDEYVKSFAAKLADLEDRNRRNKDRKSVV